MNLKDYENLEAPKINYLPTCSNCANFDTLDDIAPTTHDTSLEKGICLSSHNLSFFPGERPIPHDCLNYKRRKGVAI